MEQETSPKMERGPIDIRGSIPERDGICTACDSRGDRGTKLALSRTAQRHVFALWIFASGPIGRRLPIDPFDGFSIFAAPPGGRMHRLLTTLGRGFKEWIGWKRRRGRADRLFYTFH